MRSKFLASLVLALIAAFAPATPTAQKKIVIWHGYRGDGAFGQYMLILPQYDAVVAITSGVRDMQAVMNLVWDRLLPEMKAAPLPPNAVAQRELKTKLGALTMRTSAGKPTSPLARWAASGSTARSS